MRERGNGETIFYIPSGQVNISKANQFGRLDSVESYPDLGAPDVQGYIALTGQQLADAVRIGGRVRVINRALEERRNS